MAFRGPELPPIKETSRPDLANPTGKRGMGRGSRFRARKLETVDWQG